MGIDIEHNSLALSVVVPDAEMHFKHKISYFRSVDNEDALSRNLNEIVKQNKLTHCSCNWVLSHSQYKIYQIDLPDANEAEMLPTVTWAVKDLLDFNVADAVLDYYPVPEECVRGSQKKINVVVANRPALQDKYDLIKASGLSIEVIDIPELALKNLVRHIETDHQAIGFLYQNPDSIILGIYRDEKLLFSRVLSGVRSLQDAMDIEKGPRVKDAILLEVQRTLDYYESQLAQPPLKTIYIQPLMLDASVLIDYLNENLNPTMKSMDLNQHVLSIQKISPPVQFGCLKSIGVALREVEKDL